ncbi:fatty acid metabolism regulator protein [Desulfosarcina widdelii]|uniref:Fatty acid metabolism regulator protein n=1 Tax=Desulfosarcina widdelii TaxID=947919 RepID=A0A5K7Z5G7_9BACT|nr:GntR family transcriptional regulator [Desulfosarcina widdelii]BBO77026.1 fatty acid metabolism regulator protein [Desulfosarcina widdelii]
MKPTSSSPPIRPAQRAEHKIVTGILDGTFAPGSVLPSERQLAEILCVARPPLRETLQRLAAQGWLTIAHGKPTVVNDYWEKGGMGLLSTLARYVDTLPHGFVVHLLEVRSRLLPIIAELAVKRAPDAVLAFLDKVESLEDNAPAFAVFDWQLQLFMAGETGNPIYKLMFNDFSVMFATLAAAYFSRFQARAASRSYYRELAAAIPVGGKRVEAVVMAAMEESVTLWKRIGREEG